MTTILGPLMHTLGITHANGADVSDLEAVIVIAAASSALYSLAKLWAIERQEQLATRISTLRGRVKDSGRKAAADEPVDMARLATQWSERLGALLAASPLVGSADRARMSKMLADAGLRGSGRMAMLVAAKLGGLVLAVLGTWLLLQGRGLFVDSPVIRIGVFIGAGLAGWRVPDIIVGFLARRRRLRIEDGMPDALDLMVISVESGLSLDQAIGFVSGEIAMAWPEVAQELEITAAELRVLGDRREALENFANRVGLQSVRSIVATLVQTMRYGTPLAQSLRVLAAEMRTARLLRIEERAAQLPVLLSIPLILFILPCTFIVVAGPAVMRIGDAFTHHNPTQISVPVK